ncbi:MAG: DUF1446 domain-containing protein [Acidobacteria bacterium]|nr:DUF1446 domain-containing protein [Acidobacteriota bacterium]
MREQVAVNRLGGHKNSVTVVLTGLNVEEKARWAAEMLVAELGGPPRAIRLSGPFSGIADAGAGYPVESRPNGSKTGLAQP